MLRDVIWQQQNTPTTTRSPLHVVFRLAVGVAAAEHHPRRVRHNWGVAAVGAPHPQARVVVHRNGDLRRQLGQQATHHACGGHPQNVKEGLHSVAPLGRRSVGVPVLMTTHEQHH